MTRSERWCADVLCLLAALVILPVTVSAQAPAWRITGSANQIWFSSVVSDTTDFKARPTNTVGWGLTVDHAFGRIRAGIGLTHTSSDIEGYGPDLGIVDRENHMRQFELAALLTVPLVRVGQGGAEFLLTAGPMVGFWSITNDESRTTFGGLAALQFVAPITPGWQLLASAGGSVSDSPIQVSELPPDLKPTTLWSGRVGLGVRYGF